jgi:hypothetical protein
MIIFTPNKKIQMKYFKWFTPLMGILFLVACNNDPLNVDISGVDLSVEYTNFDSTMRNTNATNLGQTLQQFQERMPQIMGYQLAYCWQVGLYGENGTQERILQFQQQPHIQKIERRIAQHFKDLPNRHDHIVAGFKHLKVHFPDAKLPKRIVYTYSNFAASAFCTENEIAIGLERYLGPNTDVIQQLPPDQFYTWIKEAMDQRYLERDAVCAWILTHILEEKEDLTTIEAIIQWGKILYLTEAAFPQSEKEIIVRYSKQDYNWALENERNFWDYLVKQKLLFSKSEKDQANFLKEAPFTAGLPQKGPDRLGQFLGWRIVQSYMAQNDISLQELIKLPYTELLQEYEINE